MKPKVNSYEFAKVLKSALTKGQNEDHLTVNELLNQIKKQLESHYKN